MEAKNTAEKKKTVVIEWDKPVLPSEVDSSDSGIYQFYGYHPVYGDHVLLYIGVTEGCDGFKDRIPNHEFTKKEKDNVPTVFRPDSIRVRIGRITRRPENITLKEIEAVLIFMHNPAWNSNHIRRRPPDSENITIKNEGDRGALWPTVEGSLFYKFSC